MISALSVFDREYVLVNENSVFYQCPTALVHRMHVLRYCYEQNIYFEIFETKQSNQIKFNIEAYFYIKLTLLIWILTVIKLLPFFKMSKINVNLHLLVSLYLLDFAKSSTKYTKTE